MQSLSSQFFAFGITVIGGLLLGLLFDFYRVARGLIRPKKVITHLGDLLFWLISTVVIFIFLLFGNWGEVRFYVFVGLLLGTFVYLRLFSNRVIKFLLLLIKTLRTIKLGIVKLVLFLYGVISYPFIVISRIVLIPAGFLGRVLVSVKSRMRKAMLKIRLRCIKKGPPAGPDV